LRLEEQGCGAETQILGSGSVFKHLKFLAPAPQPCVRKQAMKTVLLNSILKNKNQLGLSWKKFFDALENTIKFHQIYIWIQASFLSSCFKCHKILKIWWRILPTGNTVAEYFNAW